MNRPDDDRPERELEALDRLLDAQPEPRPPAGLAERVLAATAAERAAAARPAPSGGGRLLTLAGFGAALAAAAALVLWIARPGAGADRPEEVPTRVASADPRSEDAKPGQGPSPEGPYSEEPATDASRPGPSDGLPAPPELLAELELLEEWELLVPDDLDLLLADLDELDELLLELPAADETDAAQEEQG